MRGRQEEGFEGRKKERKKINNLSSFKNLHFISKSTIYRKSSMSTFNAFFVGWRSENIFFLCGFQNNCFHIIFIVIIFKKTPLYLISSYLILLLLFLFVSFCATNLTFLFIHSYVNLEWSMGREILCRKIEWKIAKTPSKYW